MSEDAEVLHRQLVDGLVKSEEIRSQQVEGAFRAHPRHWFLPGADLKTVYQPLAAIPTRHGANGELLSSSTAPNIMAFMLEALDLQPGLHVLEIGTGTGYNAALIAHIVGQQGALTSVEVDEDVAREATERLSGLGLGPIEIVTADGWRGSASRAPFDRIVVTASVSDLSPDWVGQLREGGILVAPMRFPFGQWIVAFRKESSTLHSTAITGGSFIPLRGAEEAPAGVLSVFRGKWTLTFQSDSPPDISLRALATLLDEQPRVEEWTDGMDRFWWIGLEQGLDSVWLGDQARHRAGAGLLDAATLSLAAIIDHQLFSFGEVAARRLRASLDIVKGKRLRIDAHPASTAAPESGGRIVTRRHHRFVARLE